MALRHDDSTINIVVVLLLLLLLLLLCTPPRIVLNGGSGPTIPRPVELRSKVLSPSTVWLEWKDPTLGRVQRLTDSRYYNVHYRRMMTTVASGAVGRDASESGGAGGEHSAAAGRTLSVVVKATHIVFYDLQPGTRYEFKVRTVKDAIASEFSDIIVNKTYETGIKFHSFAIA